MGFSPAEVSRGLVDLLDLDAGTEPGVFTGRSAPQPGGHVFGGQVMGQAIVAAQRTVPEHRPLHSMNGYFLRAGDAEVPIRFEAEDLRDGGSFSARRVQALQHDQPIFSMIASFQELQPGLEHQDAMPPAPDPETLPTTLALLGGIDHPVAQYWAHQRPIDLRHVTDPVYVAPAGTQESSQMTWFRLLSPVDAPPAVHTAILAFASDYTPFEVHLRKHGLSWVTPGVKAATLDHGMWFFGPVDANEWHLYVQESPAAGGSRGLSTGRIFSRSGILVALVAQEGMLRVPLP